jgi:hypothetical protein
LNCSPARCEEAEVSDNVTTLYGGSVPKSLEIVEPLVRELEKLLDDARSGKVVAVAAAIQLYNDEAGVLIRGRMKPFVLVGALEAAKKLLLGDFLQSRPPI